MLRATVGRAGPAMCMAPGQHARRPCGGGATADPAAEAGWVEVQRVQQAGGLKLGMTMWRHRVHGSSVVLADTPGPICSVAMYFSTEARDNKGLPHCLEHLCFMGSSSHRRGLLDLLATRCGADGTNAYTEDDHTCYEFNVAGEEGLCTVLPVFLDHVLCPQLSEQAFLTEIFHINGKGERQGVVFSEMLGRETDEMELLSIARRQATFGDHSPYSYNCGGLPDEIINLTRDEVAAYHREVYTTDNLRVVLCGQLDSRRLLATLGSALDAAVAGGAQQRCARRPFAARLPPPPPQCSRRRTVQFPSDEVSVGSVGYSIRMDGTTLADVDTLTALDCLFRYLHSLASSPLEQSFVQVEPQIASGVSCDVCYTADPHITLDFSGVPFRASPEERAAAEEDADSDSGCSDASSGAGSEAEAEAGESADGEHGATDWFAADNLLEKVVAELEATRAALAEGGAAFDQLRKAVAKERVARLEHFEDEPHEFVHGALQPYLCFADYPGAAPAAGPLGVLDARARALSALTDRPSQWWAELLDNVMLKPLRGLIAGEANGAAAEVRSCPSALLAHRTQSREERMTKQNAKRLGPKKLRVLQDRLDRAVSANKVDIPEQRKLTFPAALRPDCAADLPWDMQKGEDPTAEQPLQLMQVAVQSAFLELRLHFCMDDAAFTAAGRSPALRRYLHLFQDLVTETCVAGEDYRTVVARLDDELVSYGASCGRFSGYFSVGIQPHWFCLHLSAEPHRASELVAWADALLHDCDFTAEKLLSTCRRTASDLSESMRDAQTVMAQVLPLAVHGPTSPQVALGMLSQRDMVERTCGQLQKAAEALRQLRDTIAAPTTPALAVLSGGAAEQRAAVADALQRRWAARHAAPRPPLLGPPCQPNGLHASPLLPFRHFVVGCAGADTAQVHLRHVMPPPMLMEDPGELWALSLLCEALSASEGPLYAAMRDHGLAYGASVSYMSWDNSVALDLNECTNVRKALDGALAVVRTALDGDALSDFHLANARGALIYHIKSKRLSPTNIADAALTAMIRGRTSAALEHDFEQRIAAVTGEDVRRAHRHLANLLDPGRTIACVVCDPSQCKAKAKSLGATLGLEGGSVKVQQKLSECFDLVDARVSAAFAALGS
eukprot:TRINITY_DN60405_c0_g1_i1.p1 TRINITY_DN60405_c0_g1~~TRINITY_DN60405_c0_g1_i1.p1  ORF type:complete len:1128 (+),score=331.08 TRINITY_DN60405_c0_g1_i1:74-3457(+)